MAYFIRAKAAYEVDKKEVFEPILLDVEKVERFEKNNDGTRVYALMPFVDKTGKQDQYTLVYPTFKELQTILEDRGLLAKLPTKQP